MQNSQLEFFFIKPQNKEKSQMKQAKLIGLTDHFLKVCLEQVWEGTGLERSILI